MKTKLRGGVLWAMLWIEGTALASFAQTPVLMASQSGLSYTENFADIGNWADQFSAGAGAAHFGAVPVNTTAGSIPDGIRITTASTVFKSGISAGVQRGTSQATPLQSIVLLAAGSTDNSSSVAIDFFMDFSGVKAGTLSFDWAVINNSTGNRKGSLRVYYSTDGKAFAELTAAQVLNFTNNSPGSGSITKVALPAGFDNSPSARLRFYCYNGTGGTTGSRPKISLDNLTVTAIPAKENSDTLRPVISLLSPSHRAMNVAPTTIPKLRFNEPVKKGTGFLFFTNTTDHIRQSIPIDSSIVSLQGDSVALHLPLTFSKNYAIELDSGTFKDLTGNDFTGLQDSAWTFATAAQLTDFHFDSCSPAGNTSLPDGFTHYSVTGAQTWSCSAFGQRLNGIQIHGFVPDSGAVDNEDWLISPAFDLSGYHYPLLSFYSRNKFWGPSLQLKISTDYKGSGNPLLAHWTSLNGKFPLENTDQWTLSSHINLAAFRQAKTYLAFVYTASPAAGAARWTIDDLFIQDTTAAPAPSLSYAPATIDYGYAPAGKHSAASTFSFWVNDPTSSLTLTAPAGFELSRDSLLFTNSIDYTLAEVQAGRQTAFVRFAPLLADMDYTGKISFTAEGLTVQKMDLSGTSQPTLKVVNWNLNWFGSPANGPANDQEQEEKVKTILQQINADLYALVEVVDTNRLKNVAAALGDYSFTVSDYASQADSPSDPDYAQAQKMAFVYRNSVIKKICSYGLLRSKVMPTDPDETGSKAPGTAYNNWASGRFPFLMEADVTLNGITKRIDFIVIHAKAHTGTESEKIAAYRRRKNGAKELGDTLNRQYPSAEFLILGDYNDDLDKTITSEILPDTTSAYIDLLLQQGSYVPLTLPLSLAGKQSTVKNDNVIDHVLASDEMVRSYKNHSAQILSNVAQMVSNYSITTSDHYPVMTQYVLTPPSNPPTVYVKTADSLPNETGPVPGRFIIQLSQPASATGAVVYFTISTQGAADPDDITGLHIGTDSVFFNVGDSIKLISFSTVDDSDDDDGESVNIKLNNVSASSGFLIGNPDSASLIILDNDTIFTRPDGNRGPCLLTDTTYFQDFNRLADRGAADSTTLPTGWRFLERGTHANKVYTASNGSASSGDTYSFGSNGHTDRAMGTLLSGTLNAMIGIYFTNNTTDTITGMNISYTGEQWRLGAQRRPDSLLFQYSVNASTLNNGNWTSVPALHFASPLATAAAIGALNGNDSLNRKKINGSINGLHLAPGSGFWLRWTDYNAKGADDGLGIDDLSIHFQTRPALPPAAAPPDTVRVIAGTPPPNEEGTLPGRFLVKLSRPLAMDSVKIHYTIATQGATTPDDFTGLKTGSNVMRLVKGDSLQELSFSTTDDLVDDDGEKVIFQLDSLGSNSSYLLVIPDSAVLEIIDNDPPAPVVTKIHSIQGNGPAAAGTFTIEGIVTGVYPDLMPAGYYLQEEDSDTDSTTATSEGIFVVDTIRVEPGDQVRITGTVQENGFAPSFNQAVIKDITGFQRRSSQNALPTTVQLSLSGDAPLNLEPYEGMLVQFRQTLTVTENDELGRYGVLKLAADGRLLQPTQCIDPNDDPPFGTTSSGYANASAVTAAQAANNNRKILLDDGSSSIFPRMVPYFDTTHYTLRIGSTVSNLKGIVGYGFGQYRLQPLLDSTGKQQVSFTYAARPAVPAFHTANLVVASFNTANFFNGDGRGGNFPTPRGANNFNEFKRQKTKLLQAIIQMNPDLIGLMEVENDGTTSGSAIRELVDGLNELAGANTFSFINDQQVNNTDLIRSVIVYKPARLTPIGNPFSPNDRLFERQPVAQLFAGPGGQKFVFVVNHLKAKTLSGSGLDKDQGDGQGPYNYRRKLQAGALISFLKNTVIPATGTDKVLSVGDYNSYFQEDPIDTLRASGWIVLGDSLRLSYQLAGQSGALDHALVSNSLLPQVVGIASWSINADEPPCLNYNDNVKEPGESPADINQGYLYQPNAFRSSDHDPLLIGLLFSTITAVNDPVTRPPFPAPLLYPNPATTQLYLRIHPPNAQMIQIRIMAIGGKTEYQTHRWVASGPQTLLLPISELPPGWYVLSISGSSMYHNEKFVIQ